MTPRQLLCVVLLVAILVGAVYPGRAEAIEPTVVLLIVGGVVVLVAIIVVVVIANVREHQRGAAADPTAEPESEPVRIVAQSA